MQVPDLDVSCVVMCALSQSIVILSSQMRNDMIGFSPKPYVDCSQALSSSTDQCILRQLMAHFELPGGVTRQVKASCSLTHRPAVAQQCPAGKSSGTKEAEEEEEEASACVDWFYLKDLFGDVRGLMGKPDTLLADNRPCCYSPAICGTTIALASNHFAEIPLPIKLDLAVIVTMAPSPTHHTSEPQVHTFTMENLINMYSWVRSIRKAVDFHKLHNSSCEEAKCSVNCHHAINDSALNAFDSNYFGSINYVKEGKFISCSGQIDAEQMTLKLTNAKSKTVEVAVDLTGVDTIALSRDYESFTSHLLTVSVLAVSNLPVPKKKKQVVSTYIVVRAKGNENTQTIALANKSPYWDMDFAIKLDLAQLDDAEYLKSHGFSLFLFSGLESHEEIIGQSFVSYSDLLLCSSTAGKSLYAVDDMADVLHESSESADAESDCRSSEAKVWQKRQFDIFMDMNLSIEVDVHSGRDLLASSNINNTSSMLTKTLSILDTKKCVPAEGGGGRNPYLVVSFVSSNGEALGRSHIIIKYLYCYLI
jgi:hypothetical protein